MTRKALRSKVKYFLWILLFIYCSLLIGIFFYFKTLPAYMPPVMIVAEGIV